MFRPLAIAASVALLCAFIGVAFWAGPYDGETSCNRNRRTAHRPLTDGSVVQLNSQSRLRVSFSEHAAARGVDRRPEALFEVTRIRSARLSS